MVLSRVHHSSFLILNERSLVLLISSSNYRPRRINSSLVGSMPFCLTRSFLLILVSIMLVMLRLLHPTALLRILHHLSNILEDNFKISTKVLKVAQTILHMQRTLLLNLALLERSLRMMSLLPIW
jgi:hypothetical protein